MDLKYIVAEKASEYVRETGTQIELFPKSIVDFVLETVADHCHFPNTYTDDQITQAFSRRTSQLAMMCAEVYAKAGAEGQLSHSENGVSRSYKSSWISPNLFDGFPNFVNTPSTIRI